MFKTHVLLVLRNKQKEQEDPSDEYFPASYAATRKSKKYWMSLEELFGIDQSTVD